MNSLNELVGTNVNVMFDNDELTQEVFCKVLQVRINDYYYEEKDENIYIEVNVEPLESYNNIDLEEFSNIGLNRIRRNNYR